MEIVTQAVDLFFSERFCFYRNIAAVLGAAYLLYVSINLLSYLASGLNAYILAPCGITRINLKKYGSWAIVTGASEGIGRAYALELAKRGLNVAIMSRSEEKLNKVATEIKNRYNREVRVIPVDFTEGQSVYADIQAEISDLDVAVLVNNVGLNLKGSEYYANVSEIRHRNIIEVNCQTLIQMTHLVLPKMVEKKKGIIINLSSVICICPSPLAIIYGATKEFINYFSNALRYEYQSKGIIVQTVYPGFVVTAMTEIPSPRLWAPSPEIYASRAVATIGVQNETNGYIIHALQDYFTAIVPQSVSMRATYCVFLNNRRHRLAAEQKKK